MNADMWPDENELADIVFGPAEQSIPLITQNTRKRKLFDRSNVPTQSVLSPLHLKSNEPLAKAIKIGKNTINLSEPTKQAKKIFTLKQPHASTSSSTPTQIRSQNNENKPVAGSSKTVIKKETKLRIISGPAHAVLDCVKAHPHLNAMFEVFGNVFDIRDGAHKSEKILLLRSGMVGPILQASYFDIDVKNTTFDIGNFVRLMVTWGPITESYRIHKLTILSAENSDNMAIRLANISRFALTLLANNNAST